MTFILVTEGFFLFRFGFPLMRFLTCMSNIHYYVQSMPRPVRLFALQPIAFKSLTKECVLLKKKRFNKDSSRTRRAVFETLPEGVSRAIAWSNLDT